MKEQVKLQVSGKLESLSLISDFIVNSMLKFGMGDHEMFQTQIAVDEAITNIIMHGELEEKDKISLKCEKDRGMVKIVIEDEAKPFDPTTTEDPDLLSPVEEREVGGLGVYFIKEYMDEIKYDFKDGKNILTMVKYL
jgi:serine/threonine-protein kinase RsbW